MKFDVPKSFGINFKFVTKYQANDHENQKHKTAVHNARLDLTILCARYHGDLSYPTRKYSTEEIILNLIAFARGAYAYQSRSLKRLSFLIQIMKSHNFF